MSVSYRRYEVLLPLRFNDGQRVPSRLLTESIIELREQFGAASCETQAIQGQWRHSGEVFRDELIRVFVDVEDTAANREFLLQFKQQLKDRFRQIEIWVTSYPIDLM